MWVFIKRFFHIPDKNASIVATRSHQGSSLVDPQGIDTPEVSVQLFVVERLAWLQTLPDQVRFSANHAHLTPVVDVCEVLEHLADRNNFVTILSHLFTMKTCLRESLLTHFFCSQSFHWFAFRYIIRSSHWQVTKNITDFTKLNFFWKSFSMIGFLKVIESQFCNHFQLILVHNRRNRIRKVYLFTNWHKRCF